MKIIWNNVLNINFIYICNRLNQDARLLVATLTSTPIPVVISKSRRDIGMIADLQGQVNISFLT